MIHHFSRAAIVCVGLIKEKNMSDSAATDDAVAVEKIGEARDKRITGVNSE